MGHELILMRGLLRVDFVWRRNNVHLRMHFIFVVKRDSDLRRFGSYPHVVIADAEKTGLLKTQKVIAGDDTFEAEAPALSLRRPPPAAPAPACREAGEPVACQLLDQSGIA